VAIVCVIGSNIAIPGVLEKAVRVLAENSINVICVSQSMRQVNMQFVIERKDYRSAVKALNQRLCLE
jgi:aspartate kinase